MPVKVERGGASVEIAAATPRTKMTINSYLVSVGKWYADYAKKVGVEEDALDSVLTDFVTFSARAGNPEGLDFELLTLADGPDEIIRKFEQYLDTTHGELVTAALDGAKKLDRPAPLVKQPTPLAENSPKA